MQRSRHRQLVLTSFDSFWPELCCLLALALVVMESRCEDCGVCGHIRKLMIQEQRTTRCVFAGFFRVRIIEVVSAEARACLLPGVHTARHVSFT